MPQTRQSNRWWLPALLVASAAAVHAGEGIQGSVQAAAAVAAAVGVAGGAAADPVGVPELYHLQA